MRVGRLAPRRWTCSPTSRPMPSIPLFAVDSLIATPHIGGSTEEAQEIVGVRIAEQMVEYLQNGVAINAVNMPALSPEQYRELGPYIEVAQRLGNFAAYVGAGKPEEHPDDLLWPNRRRQYHTAAQRRTGGRAESIDGEQRQRGELDADRGGTRLEHQRESGQALGPQGHHPAGIGNRQGSHHVEGSVLLGKARLLQLDGIYCEAALPGHLICMKNDDVPA